MSGLLTFFVVVTRGNKMNGREKEREAPGFDVDDQYQRVERCVQTRRALERCVSSCPASTCFHYAHSGELFPDGQRQKGGDCEPKRKKKKFSFVVWLSLSVC